MNHPCDRQTDGQMDGIAIAYARLAYMLPRAKRRYVMIYVPYGQPNGWADRDQTWHTHSCSPRECFWQGQCQGHSCMRVEVTELRNTRHAARKRHLANGADTTSGRRRRRHLANDYETPSNYSSSNEARRRRRRAASAAGASRTPSGGRVLTASKQLFLRHKAHLVYTAQ